MHGRWFVWLLVTDSDYQLGNSLAQNCGPKIHRELASRSFTDALLRLANDRVCIFNGAVFLREGLVANIVDPEHAPTSKIEDLGAHAGMDRDVLFKP